MEWVSNRNVNVSFVTITLSTSESVLDSSIQQSAIFSYSFFISANYKALANLDFLNSQNGVVKSSLY